MQYHEKISCDVEKKKLYHYLQLVFSVTSCNFSESSPMLRSTVAAHSALKQIFFFITSDIFIHYLFQTRGALGCI